jgi:hypothetical protein
MTCVMREDRILTNVATRGDRETRPGSQPTQRVRSSQRSLHRPDLLQKNALRENLNALQRIRSSATRGAPTKRVAPVPSPVLRKNGRQSGRRRANANRPIPIHNSNRALTRRTGSGVTSRARAA